MRREQLREQQFSLARHLRDPGTHAPPPGIEERRGRIYRELFFNNIENLLSSSFPVIRETLGPARWQALVRSFFGRHRSATPLFPKIAAEFVAYIEEPSNAGALPAWLAEMAHYEWIEQAVFISDAQPPEHDPSGDLLAGVPVLSPLARPLFYRWPVAEIGPSYVPREPPVEPTLLLVHRDTDHQVNFARLSPLSFYLLASIQAHQRTGRAHLNTMAAESGGDAATIQIHGEQLLEQLRKQRVIVGTAASLAVHP